MKRLLAVAACVVSLQVMAVAEGLPATLELFRLYNPARQLHVFTASSGIVRDALSRGYVSEACSIRTYKDKQAEMVPLWRLYKERGAASGLAATEQRIGVFESAGYGKEEILGYAYPKPRPGSIPLYEFAIPPSGKSAPNDVLWHGKDMFYTTDPGEILAILARSPDTYVGICCYVPDDLAARPAVTLPAKPVAAPQERWFTQVFAGGGSRGHIGIPDIPGYKTLKCDFHMHSVFSDGEVWPDVRAGEIWREGLDAFSVTDHVEFRPHSSDLPGSLNRPYEIASAKANELGIICVRGAEITKDFRDIPFSANFNALFLKDADRLGSGDLFASLQEARSQGAFVFWCHPPEAWPPEMDLICQSGLVQGFEAVNGGDHCKPNVFRWTLEKGLAVMASTDMHEPIALRAGQHRQMTLVFAKERTEESIKEALEGGRTLAYFGTTLAGPAKYLEAVFRESIGFSQSLAAIGAGPTVIQIRNGSDLPFQLANISSEAFATNVTSAVLPPNGKLSLTVTLKDPAAKNRYLDMTVKNLLAGPDKPLAVRMKP